MDVPNSAEAAAAKCLENDGKEFYEVPEHLVEWKEKPNERRVLIVKNENGTHYRKYKPGENDTTFYCWSCYIIYGLHVNATFLNGIVKAPLRHACDWLPLTNQEKIEKVKLETNDKINANPSSSSSIPSTSTSATKSNVLVLENPCKNISSNPDDDDDSDRPLSRESDVIFIENDEIKPDYNNSSTSFTEKLQAFKRRGAYRTVAPSEYEEAYSAGGYKGNRIIVFEENVKSRVRQYAGNNNNYWYCLGCFRGKKKTTQAFQENDKTFLVPKEHVCTPLSYKKVKKEQQKIVKRLKINEEDGSTGDEDIDDEESDASTPSPPPEFNSIRSRLRSRSPAAQVFSSSSSIKGKEKPLQVKKPPERKRRAAPPIVSTHEKRAVKEGGYLRGVGAQNQANGRIIVFLDDDKTRVHEYRKSVLRSFYCRGCFAMDKSKKRYGIMGNDKIFRVPLLDEHICQPLPYADIQEEQKAIKEKYAPKKVATVKQSKSANRISTSATSSSSKTAPLQSAPLLSGPRLRSRTRTPVDSPASAVSTFSETPVLQRERTPYLSFLQRILKRKAERQDAADSEAPKKSKPTEGEAETPDSHQINEKPKENSAKTFQYSRIVRDNTFKRNILNAANDTYRNGSQTMENSSTAPSSTASTPVNRPPSIGQNVFSSTSLSTPLPSIPPSTTPIPPPPTPPSTGPSPSPIVASSTQKISTIPSLTNLLSATSTPLPSSAATSNSSSTTTVKFYKPSQYFLEKCCKKFGMDYTDQVYKFWFNISIHQVSPSSIPDKLYPTVESEYHGFECLSLFIIGSEDKAADIREKLNEHMYHENTRNSTAPNREIEAVALFSSSVTERHLTLIASWLDCRIGIFAEGEWKRYGNWDATDADIPILLMEFKNGKYFPVLMLK